jgi:hypothetical protein
MIINNGKTNQFGRMEYGAVTRHKDLFLCTLSHTAFYLFYRWHCVREAPPRFQQRQQWYDLKLLRGDKNTVSLSYEIQLTWTNKIFKGADLMSLKKTHAGRAQGAKQAELSGVSESQIRRAGRWNSDALSNCYLSNLPREFIRSMAGFEPHGQGNYYLPRAKVEPPQSLLRTVWPWVDEWLEWFSQAAPSASYEHIVLEPLSPFEEDRQDLAAQGFLRLLLVLRMILLQDSVLLRREYPDHIIWQDPIFVREDYLRFAEEVELSIREVEEPQDLRIRRVLPDVANKIDTHRQDIVRTVTEYGSRNRQIGESNQRKLDSIDSRLDSLLSGRSKISIMVHPPDELATSATQQEPLRTTALEDTVAATASVAPHAPELASTASMALHNLEQASSTSDGAVPEPVSVIPLNPDDPPLTYCMSRTITSVQDLWREWYNGLAGFPSVQALEAAYGAKWRPKQSERMFFGRRKLIIDEVNNRHASGTSLPVALEELDSVRRRLHGSSLHGLAKWIRERRNQLTPDVPAGPS